jgi:hypothetical protein
VVVFLGCAQLSDGVEHNLVALQALILRPSSDLYPWHISIAWEGGVPF